MIVISDGDPTPPTPAILQGFVQEGIKISTVAVGTHGPAESGLLQRIAVDTGGMYYKAASPSVLPKIFMREARRVARPLIFEPQGGVQPMVTSSHETLTGIPNSLPGIKGFVLTHRKDSPLVEVPILSPLPAEEINASILATWTYGLGRTAVFTSDVGKTWATDWLQWSNYDQFFSQLVRWTMRPTAEDGKYQVATQIRDGKVQTIVTAMDREDRLVNFLEMTASAIGPDLQPFSFSLKQKAPGRYVGEFEITASGAYILNVIPAPGQAPLTTGVTVPFSDEYRVRQTNRRLLEEIAQLTPVGGQSGQLLEPLDSQSLKKILDYDPFRSDLPKARSLEDVWPLAVLVGAVLFFSDVLVRRVAFDPMIAARWLHAKLRPGESTADAGRRATLDRLRSKKSDVAEELDKQRAATSFEVDGNSIAPTSTAADQFSSPSTTAEDTRRSASSPSAPTPESTESSYTARLLDAKRKAQSKKDNQ